MQVLLLPFCVVLFFAVMALRLKFLPRDTRKRTAKERLKYLRILFLGLLALMAVGYRLQRASHEMDANGEYEPSAMERIVMSFSK